MLTRNKLLIILATIYSCSPTIMKSCSSGEFLSKSDYRYQQPIHPELPLTVSTYLHDNYYKQFSNTFTLKSYEKISYNLDFHTPCTPYTPLYVPQIGIHNTVIGHDGILVYMPTETYNQIIDGKKPYEAMAILLDANPSFTQSLLNKCSETKCYNIVICSMDNNIEQLNTENISSDRALVTNIDSELSAAASFLVKQYVALQHINKIKQKIRNSYEYTYNMNIASFIPKDAIPQLSKIENSNSINTVACLYLLFWQDNTLSDTETQTLSSFLALRKQFAKHNDQVVVTNNGSIDNNSVALAALLSYHKNTVFNSVAEGEEIKIQQLNTNQQAALRQQSLTIQEITKKPHSAKNWPSLYTLSTHTIFFALGCYIYKLTSFFYSSK